MFIPALQKMAQAPLRDTLKHAEVRRSPHVPCGTNSENCSPPSHAVLLHWGKCSSPWLRTHDQNEVSLLC